MLLYGGPEVASDLLEFKWDYIFFTGSIEVGKIVAKAAAVNLTPTTLELGGKNPCIIDETASIKVTAKRIVWGKFTNCGQTCIAPDFLIVNKKIKNSLIKELINQIIKTYSLDVVKCEEYGRIINEQNLKNLASLIENQEILYGGHYDLKNKYFSPTIINNPELNSSIMSEEIFGPILPVLEYEKTEDIFKLIYRFEKPLALYVFTKNSNLSDEIINKVSFGGGVINDTMIQFGNHRLPFGGVGHSGMGAYHGKFSFDIFTHHKPFVKKAFWLDVPTRYAPYPKTFKVLKKLLRFLT